MNKSYGENKVVQNLNLNIEEGEFLTMLGPSGCGKTTTLRMVAGFEMPTNGNIYVENEEIQDTEPYDREVNTVFQNYALFPHMTIFDNIAYGLKLKKVPKAEIKERVLHMLDLVQLTGYEKRKPDQLSGGQKQRVAIARALINKPKVLLLDEPLGALDLKLRKQMQFELKRLQRKLGITFIYVTHDQEEALTMSDRIAIMYKGNLEQVGTPKEIYEKPASKFVADFIGESNIFYASIAQIEDGIGELVLENGEVPAYVPDNKQNDIVFVSVRPENMHMSKQEVPGFNLFGEVKEQIYIGNVNKVLVVLPSGYEVKVNLAPKETMPSVGETVFLHWEIEDGVVIQSDSQPIFHAVDNPVFNEVNN